MDKKIFYSFLQYLLIFTSFSIGFSSWSIANNKEIFGNITAEQTNTFCVLNNTNVDSFEISNAGLVEDETIVNECSAVFTFAIENKYVSNDNINYLLTLSICNINNSIETYCKDDFILIDNKTSYKKLNPFPIYDNNLKRQIYRQNIVVEKDITSSLTVFTVAFVFNNNFYGILNNDLSLKVSLIGV